MTSSQARRLAVTLILTASVAYTLAGAVLYYRLGLGYGLLTSAVSAATAVLLYLNARTAMRGERPPLFPLTLVLQCAVTYLPDLLPFGWSAMAAPMLAGALLASLPLRWAVPAVTAMSLYQAYSFWAGLDVAVVTAFYVLSIPVTGAMTYALISFVRVTTALEQARADLADAAVLKERLRISRDLHDGLGHSLTAIALKGDLAARLMTGDPDSARAEVGELVKVAREAAQDVRQVARGYRAMSLRGEVDRAVALLESSGVNCQTHLADVPLPAPSEEALAWAVREAVTNVLRHSRATTCTITTSRREGGVRLEVANDGAPAAPGTTGAGLSGLAERAGQAGGSCSAGAAADGGFLLAMEVPAMGVPA
ncbi:sensor histidine kinase [Nonomuraea sp. NN258]|uniref:sensor histidine kinase n=1 Tax=Nonomuraea antri TaxID=2730852 RepID=UPI0015689093|nr:sensor histidine kinase [Nonomuraea antri]NRQ40252.1 sensor histidine kinase [Nonomuraea antri]